MKNNIKIPLLFFILIYFNQGWSDLPSQAIYYLTRETWGLNAGTIGFISFITALAWYIKVIWGFCLDFVKLGKNSTRNYLLISYSIIIGICLYVCLCGLNFWSLIITGLILNCCIGICDTGNDKQMIIYEQKYNLKGRLQAVQWSSLGVAGLLVAILGAKIPDIFSVNVAYKVAYGSSAIIPLIIIIYLLTNYTEQKSKPKKCNWKLICKELKNKQLLISLLFIGCLQLCPSFGTALMIKAREELLVSKMFLGYLGATGTVLGLIGYGLYYWKCYKFSMQKMLYFMIIFTACTNLFYLYIPNQWYLLLYNLLFGTISGITFLTLLALFAQIVPKGNEGMFYALITSLSNLCVKGGSWIGGVIYDNWGYGSTVILSSVLTLICIFLIPALKIKK